MKLLFVIASVLSSVLACVEANAEAKPSLPDDLEQIRIGKLVLEDVDMSNPEDLEKIEVLRGKIGELEKSESEGTKSDLSEIPTPELVRMALSTIGSGSSYANEFKELSKRPEELKDTLRGKLGGPVSRIEDFTCYLGLSYASGRSFQLEIAKKCLFHPDMPQYDLAFLGEGIIFEILAKSESDETAVLDRLIKEGRLQKGSGLEIKWREKLSKKETGSMNQQANVNLQGPRTDSTNERTSLVGVEQSRTYILAVTMAILILFVALGVWIKGRMCRE